MAMSGRACRDMVLCAQGEDTASSGDDSAESVTSDMDLKGKPRGTRDRHRPSAASTVDMMQLKTRRGSRFRLESRTDIQEAVMWMEGELPMADSYTKTESRDIELPNTVAEEDENEAEPEPKKSYSLADDPRMLPLVLFVSLALGGACMLMVQRHCVIHYYGKDVAKYFSIVFASIYAVTFVTMAWCSCADPGQLDANVKVDPRRSHKSFQYERPLMRFDHYCRWVTNGIALRNHREFLVMLVCLELIVVLGVIVDIGLLANDVYVQSVFGVGLLVPHLVYSFIFGYYVTPIFRLHMGFVSRNELAHEWKNDLYYVVDAPHLSGDPYPVVDLEPDDFNELFDNFKYDASRNPWDKGCRKNCWMFWCYPRWSGLGNW